MFLNASDVRQLILSDPDGYLARLTPIDLKARRAGSIHEYMNSIVSNIYEFTPRDRTRIARLCQGVDAWLIRRSHITEMYGVRGRDAASLPWILAATRGKVYDNGFPHTRMSVIFVSSETLAMSDPDLAAILLHEKIHIYQRTYPMQVSDYLRRKGLVRVHAESSNPRHRSNPDTDGWVYAKNGKSIETVYRSNNPRNLADVNIQGMYGHPHEWIAYSLETEFRRSS